MSILIRSRCGECVLLGGYGWGVSTVASMVLGVESEGVRGGELGCEGWGVRV